MYSIILSGLAAGALAYFGASRQLSKNSSNSEPLNSNLGQASAASQASQKRLQASSMLRSPVLQSA
ncbi:MAG: hypothetical protein ACOYK1_07425 [Vampirovibrionia bacterium]|jgi:hypothetical protein